MKKLTELDFQNALDECAEVKFRCHGDWIAGMVKRLNKAIMADEVKIKIPLFEDPTTANYTITKTIIQSGNTTEPTIPCKS